MDSYFGNQGHGILKLSADGGQTWGPEVSFPPVEPGFLQRQLAPAIASGGGTVIVTWSELSNTPSLTAIRAAPVDPDTGAIGAATTLAVMPGQPQPLDFGGSAIPMASVVRGGPHDGAAYVVWAQRRGPRLGDGEDVAVSYSDSGGVSWSAPQIVNRPLGRVHVYPAVGTLPDGSALVAWKDSREDPADANTRVHRARVPGAGVPGPDRPITACPGYDETPAPTVTCWATTRTSTGAPGARCTCFADIRAPGGNSDVYALGARRR